MAQVLIISNLHSVSWGQEGGCMKPVHFVKIPSPWDTLFAFSCLCEAKRLGQPVGSDLWHHSPRLGDPRPLTPLATPGWSMQWTTQEKAHCCACLPVSTRRGTEGCCIWLRGTCLLCVQEQVLLSILSPHQCSLVANVLAVCGYLSMTNFYLFTRKILRILVDFFSPSACKLW